MSFELSISAKDRAVGRFVGAVRKALLVGAIEEKERSGITQQAIATIIGVHRSVINRLLKGEANLTLRSVGEIAWALGRVPKFYLVKEADADGSNYPQLEKPSAPVPPPTSKPGTEMPGGMNILDEIRKSTAAPVQVL